MINWIQMGDTVQITPAADVASGIGYLDGVALFGVATGDVASGEEGSFARTGIVEIAKTSALAITKGDRLYWDATNKCVNKTSTAQLCVGVAYTSAANPSSTVQMILGGVPAVAA